MIKNILALTTFILLSISAFAQSNYKPATVVLLNRQELNGYIDYKEWNSNPTSFSFKNSDGIRKLTVHEVASFKIGDFETFERFVLTTKSSGKVKFLNDIRNTYQFKGETDTVFLRLLTAGKLLNLYSYDDKNCTRFFTKYNRTNETTELIMDQFYDEGDATKVQENKKFRGQLSIFAHDSLASNKSKVMQLLKNTTYSYEDLAKVVNLLNGEESKKMNRLYAIKPFAGVFFQQSTATYSGETKLAEVNTAASYSPGLAGGFDFYTNYNIRKYRVRAEFGFSAASFETDNTIVNDAKKETHIYSHKFDQYTISFTPQFIANLYNKQFLKINIGTGLSFSYSNFTNSEYKTISTFYGITRDTKSDFEFRHFSISIPLRAGVIINDKFDIYGKYNLPMIPNSNYLAYELKIATIQVGVNYLY